MVDLCCVLENRPVLVEDRSEGGSLVHARFACKVEMLYPSLYKIYSWWLLELVDPDWPILWNLIIYD